MGGVGGVVVECSPLFWECPHPWTSHKIKPKVKLIKSLKICNSLGGRGTKDPTFTCRHKVPSPLK
jgi:hypothetical protein